MVGDGGRWWALVRTGSGRFQAVSGCMAEGASLRVGGQGFGSVVAGRTDRGLREEGG